MGTDTLELAKLVSGTPWRVIVDAECGAAWNMAADTAIMEAVALGMAPPTVRLYRWDAPAVSIGRMQKLEGSVDVGMCRAHGVQIVRRPTGGRAVLHGGDQTVSVAAPMAALGSPGGSVVRSYRLLSEGLVRALDLLGNPVSFGPCAAPGGRSGDCFASRTRADLVSAAGAKIVGSAQRRTSAVILQQSSIRHFEPPVDAGAILLGPTCEAGYPLVGVDEDTMEQAVEAGFAQALGRPLTEGSLSAWELERTVALARDLRCGVVVDTATGV